ncbi:hypothetical protein PM082_004315 [Marasmius tenuissimus]|nr:hypothetical protein PM082_004315 [Marasmius tenuissimus]
MALPPWRPPPSGVSSPSQDGNGRYKLPTQLTHTPHVLSDFPFVDMNPENNNDSPPSTPKSSSFPLSTGALAGIAVGILILICLVTFAIMSVRRRKKQIEHAPAIVLSLGGFFGAKRKRDWKDIELGRGKRLDEEEERGLMERRKYSMNENPYTEKSDSSTRSGKYNTSKTMGSGGRELASVPEDTPFSPPGISQPVAIAIPPPPPRFRHPGAS